MSKCPQNKVELTPDISQDCGCITRLESGTLDYCDLHNAAGYLLAVVRSCDDHPGIGEPLRSHIKAAIARAEGRDAD